MLALANRGRDGDHPSMVFTVAFCVPWCGHLEIMPDVKPQLSADDLKCSAKRLGASLILLGSLPGMSGLLVRMCLLVSVCFSALLSRCGKL